MHICQAGEGDWTPGLLKLLLAPIEGFGIAAKGGANEQDGTMCGVSPLPHGSAQVGLGPPSAGGPHPEGLRLDELLGREWLLADGVGGFASSTTILCPTRRQQSAL